MTPNEEEQDRKGWFGALSRHSGVVVGVIGLFAWFALLWFMFGDVL